MKYGLLIDPIQPEDYVLGGNGSLGGEVLRPNGDWTPFLPTNESQINTNGFDAIACASFGTLNAIEMLTRRVYEQDREFSDRFLAKVSETTPTGNSPHKVAETLRKLGVPNEVDWPYLSSIKTWDEFYSAIPQAIFSLATAFIAEFNLKHEYVPTTPALLKQALTYSPLGVSVVAWYKDDQGYNYKPAGAQDNHWVVLVGFKEGEHWLIYDSYADNGEYLKKLRWGYQFAIAKRYSISRQVVSEQSWVKWLLGLVAAAFGFDRTPAPATVTVDHTVPQEQPVQKLLKITQSVLGTDVSPLDTAPDEYGCADSVSQIVKKLYPDFRTYISTAALCDALKSDKRFTQVTAPEAGAIIISPRTPSKNGHTGIFLSDTRIASNDSISGKFYDNYSYAGWLTAFKKNRSLSVFIFKPTV